MEAVVLNAKKRELTRKGPSRRYRRDGFIPSIIYGQGKNINILINDIEFTKLIHRITKSTVIDIKIDNTNYEVLIKNYEKDYIKDKYLHIDFYELKKGKPVHFKIPLNYIGSPVGVREGGVLEKHMLEIAVECLPKDIVNQLDVNIENLKINDTLHVRDVDFDSKFKIMNHDDDVLVHVSGKAEEEEVAAIAEEIEGEEAVVEEVKEEKAEEK